MTNKTKKIIVSLVGLFVFFILLMTWFYPYSFISIHKNYSFTPDPVVVDGYVKDLNEFKSSYEKDLDELTTGRNNDLTTDRTRYLLPLFEQDWLISKESVKMGVGDLGNILFEVKNARETLLGLLTQEDYTQEQRLYLVNSIEILLLLEEDIVDIKTGKAESRKTLKTQISNLRVRFMSNFRMYESFYEMSQNE